MRGITNNSLIKVTYQHRDISVSVGQWTKVSNVAVATNPNARSVRQVVSSLAVQPFVILVSVAAHIGVWRKSHFLVAAFDQIFVAIVRRKNFHFRSPFEK